MMLPVFAPISKECVDIDISNNILAKCPPNEDLKNQYISARTNLVTQTDLSTQNKIIGAGI